MRTDLLEAGKRKSTIAIMMIQDAESCSVTEIKAERNFKKRYFSH